MATPKPSIDAAASALNAVRQCLGIHGVRFMLDGGTLLGAVRDGEFCQDDQDDIDLSILGDSSGLPDAVRQACLLGFRVHHSWPHSARGTAQLSLRRDGVKVDLMLKERVRLVDSEGDWMYWTVYGRNDMVVPKAIPMKLVEPWSTELFHGTHYNVPGDVDGYLSYRYGNWHKPVHRSAYNCYAADLSILPAAVQVMR